jgi:hypothetical protein
MNARRVAAVVAVVSVWAIARWAFWLGFAGSDDAFYVRYAELMHRQPINHWEFRSLSVWLMRLSMLAFGFAEWSACLPSLLASAATFVALARLVRWPADLTPMNTSAMLLLATLPIDMVFASYAGASSIAGGFLALGIALTLTGPRVAGGVLLTMAFMAHEWCFYPIAMFCLIALAFDHRTYRPAVAVCVTLSAVYFAGECAYYGVTLGDPMARVKAMTAGTAENRVIEEAGGSVARFYWMPIQLLVFNKGTAFGLLALLAAGAAGWRRFDVPQRILFTSAAVYLLWKGYGAMVPWEYKPPCREVRLYFPVTLAICSLVPAALYQSGMGIRRPTLIVALLVAVQLATSAAGGRWGQHVEVSRDLLAFARSQPDRRFVTDVTTMNDLYILNGCRLPANVVCLPDSHLHDLLANKEPEGHVRVRFPEGGVGGILVNRESLTLPDEEPFADYVRANAGHTIWSSPVRYRPLFDALKIWRTDSSFAVLSLGGEAIALDPPLAFAAGR